MAVNLIVLAVTLLVAGLIGLWIAVPSLRPWIELPKHRFLQRQRRFPDVTRQAGKPQGESSSPGDVIAQGSKTHPGA